jgi:hypothetical protein
VSLLPRLARRLSPQWPPPPAHALQDSRGPDSPENRWREMTRRAKMDRVFGPRIIARTLTKPVKMGPSGSLWQYHGRSDRHSKIGCWAILFDLLQTCPLLREQVAAGRVVFGINHEMRDFKQNRKKDLDLVLSTPGTSESKRKLGDSAKLLERWGIELTSEERSAFNALPLVREGPVGAVQVALEAKACMTAHVKALPRLYDELNSSHLTIHGNTEVAVAVGLVMINLAATFQSPGRPVPSKHRQPEDTVRVIKKVEELPRRAAAGGDGFDAVGIVIVKCANDGSPVELVETPPAPQPGDIFQYDQMIRRVSQHYEARFARS